MNLSNSRLITYLIIFIIIIALISYKLNSRLTKPIPGEQAQPGEYSDQGKYVNITPMKHDIFKSLTIGLGVSFIVFLGRETPFEWSDFLSFESFREFRLSILGQTILAIIGYLLYYQIIEPYFVNRIPKF